jgi:hypothetical protein
VSEEHILRNWAIETINDKLLIGFEFDLRRRGLLAKEAGQAGQLSAAEEQELCKIYD